MKSEIVDAFTMMAKDKGIDRDILASVIKESFTKMMEKKYGENANFEVIVNMDKGDIEIYLNRGIVEEVTDPNLEIDLETAIEKSGEEFEIGDEYVEEIPIEEFGRRMVINLKQNLNQKIREIEKEITYNKYKEQLGEIIVGEIYQIKPTSILLIHDGNEIIFPKSEQIPKERYKKGDTIRAIIKTIEKRPSGPPLIIVSRADEQFLDKLFELEIPEIYDGIIEIKAIAREPGERAKIAVTSNDDRIDAVGACVGMKGIRIHSIVRELSNENIDVINYTDDPALYIARALSPAKLKDIYLDNENQIAKIYSDEDQVSLIIGKGGQNIKLASKLTGYQIDVVREAEEEEEQIEDSELARSLFKEKPEESGELDEEEAVAVEDDETAGVEEEETGMSEQAESSDEMKDMKTEEEEEVDIADEIKEEGLTESGDTESLGIGKSDTDEYIESEEEEEINPGDTGKDKNVS